MTIPLYELSDVRTLSGKELDDRDQFAIGCVLEGVDRDGLRARMHDQGWRFDNGEYTQWRAAAKRIKQWAEARL